MDIAKDANELIERFVMNNRDDEATRNDLVEWLRDMQVAIEKKGRVAELKEMIKYHQRQADFSTSIEEKNTHLATIVVLEARLSYIEQPRETPPIT